MMNTAETLTRAAGDLLLKHPHLTPTRAYQMALEADPELARRHHHGDPGQAAAPPAPAAPAMVNPGTELMALCATRKITFAKACTAAPHLAAAWHKGELVPATTARAAPVSPTSEPATVESFRCTHAFELADFEARSIKGAHIFSVGTHNGTTYTLKHLHQMVDAFDKVGFRPAIKLGHNDEQELAHGYVSRIYVEGDNLLADFEMVPPETMEYIRNGRLLTVSVEIYSKLPRNNHVFPIVLKSVALLGANVPGVSGLKPLLESIAA